MNDRKGLTLPKIQNSFIRMKKNLFFVATIVILATLVNAQDAEMKYLFGGKDKIKVSGFIAPIMEYSAMGDDFAFFMGGGGAILFNQTFFFGAYGEGLTTPYETEIVFDQVNNYNMTQRIEFGHGGFWLGYIHHSQAPIHAGFSTKLGWGSINPWEEDKKPDYSSELADHVFVIIPQLEAEFNFFKWLKLNVGVGYRFVTDVDKSYGWSDELIYDKKDFNKPQASMTLMFGFFK
jgi:hypothetical protein